MNYTPPIKQSKIVRGSAVSKAKWVYIDERYEALDDCPVCGKKRSEIQRFMNKPESKPLATNKILARLKKAGLPTRV